MNFFKIEVLKNFANSTGKQGLKVCNFIKNRLQHRCFPKKFAKFLITAFFYRTFPVAASKNNEQQQLSEGFANICYKIVSPILLQELINDFASTVAEHFYLLMAATISETRTTYFK